MEGLKIHYSKNNKNLIIFIHGLFGSDKTWKNIEGNKLYDLLYNENSIKDNYDIGEFTYKSKLVSKISIFKKNNLSIKEISESFKSEIDIVAKNYENIILIGHSMGGLIAKQYLIDNLKNNKIKVYISLATPHKGSGLANYLKYYNHNQIQDLIKNNDYLMELNRQWISSNDFLPECYYFYGSYDKIVPKESAIPDPIVDSKYIKSFFYDHNKISKIDKNSTLFIGIVQVLDDFVFKINPNKIIFTNLSRKRINMDKILEEYTSKEYYLFDSLSKQVRDDIFEVSGEFTSNLKNKHLFQKYLKSHIDKIKIFNEKTENLIYTGFPLVPLAFLEGYHLKMIKEREYIVNYRKGPLKKMKYGPVESDPFNITSLESLNDINNGEICINLSYSFGITSDAINIAIPNKILEYKRTPLKVDGITNYSQVEEIAENFVNYIRGLKNNHGIKIVNIFAAVPVPLAFEIGRNLEHHDPDIFVFNYENNKYDWGINIKTGELKIL